MMDLFRAVLTNHKRTVPGRKGGGWIGVTVLILALLSPLFPPEEYEIPTDERCRPAVWNGDQTSWDLLRAGGWDMADGNDPNRIYPPGCLVSDAPKE